MHFVYYANSRGGKIIKNASTQEIIIAKVAASEHPNYIKRF